MHKECDVMKALSSALNARTSASNQRLGAQPLTSAVCTQEPCPPSHSTSSGEPTEQQIVMVTNYLNHKLHDQIKQVNQQFQNYDSPPENSLEQLLSISDPMHRARGVCMHVRCTVMFSTQPDTYNIFLVNKLIHFNLKYARHVNCMLKLNVSSQLEHIPALGWGTFTLCSMGIMGALAQV